MDISFEGMSDPALSESQPTQLLNNLFGHTAAPNPILHDRATNVAVDDDLNVNKSALGALESSSSSLRYSAPRYHFHGLAATQQTQFDDNMEDDVLNDEHAPSIECGKNDAAAHPAPAKSRSTSKTPHEKPPEHLLIGKGPVTKPAQVPVATTSHISPAKGRQATKAVSFQSPGATASSSRTKPIPTSRTMPFKTNRNDRDRLSQDSFGGAVSQDHEKDFRATAKQFHVPLSELGQPSEHETDTQPVDMESSMADEADDLARSLLALSNSDSGGAQSQDHMSQQSMDVDINADITKSYEDEPGQNTQASTQGFGVSQLSSSYERLLEGKYSQPDPHSDTQPAEPATQMNVDNDPAPLEATQPDESSGDVVMNPSEDVGTTATPHPVGGFSNPQTGPRSLASTVNKKWRLQKLNIPLPPHPPAQSLVPSSTHDPLVVPESVVANTQPSEFAETPIPHMRTFPPPRANGLSRRKLSPVSSPPRSDMEIVPDSEPPLTGPAQLTPSQHKRPVASARPQPQDTPPSPREEMAPAADYSKPETGESDDDDDVPLAVVRALPKGLQANKGKGKAVATSSAVGSSRTVTDGRQNRTGASDGRSREAGVPSSAPEQDEAKPVSVAQRGRGKGRAGKPASSASERTTRSASAASNIPVKKRRISSETDDDEDELRLKGHGPVSIPKAEKREEEEETEPADQDDYGEDVQDDNESEAEPTARKRKRVTKPKARPKTVSKASIKSNLSRGTPALHTRPNKRLRSVNSTTTRAAEDAATRVFALWKADAHYYSGTVHSHMGASQFLVQFDDDSEATVDVSKMRRRDLRPGDELILVSDNRQAVVKQAGLDGPTVEVDDGDELESFDVEFRDLRIAVRTINKHWQDRGVDIEDVVPIIRSKSLKSTPSPSKASLLSVASSKSRGKALNKIGLVITMSSNNTNNNTNEANPDAEREKITAIVKNNGGTMIDDWSSIISMDGKHSNSNKRWVAVADDIAVNCKNGITKVYLLANDANSKPKYLIALALGIPCVHLDWVHSMVEHNGLADWQPFLLPAGSSTSLGDVRMTQMVDCEWGISTAHLHDIMENQVASKLFATLSILCVGRDFVPAGKTKRTNSADGKESSRAVPSIVLAMGAKRVEAVTEAKYASDPTFKTFDFVVVKDISDSVPGLPKPNVTKLVHFPWVKESLMTGRLLPLPKW